MFTKYIGFLQAIPLFQNVDKTQFTTLLPYFHVQKFKKDDLIIVDNAEKDFFYIIYEGQVEIFKEYEDYKETLAIKEAGEFFGEMAFIDNFKRSASVKAKTDVTLISLDRSGFYKILSFPEITIVILRNITKDLRNQNNTYIKKLKKEIDSLKQSKLNILIEEKQNILYNVIIKYLYELKNPITIINGLLELFENTKIDQEKKYEIIHNLKREIKVIEEIISDLLFYSKNNYKYNYSKIELNKFYTKLEDDIKNFIKNFNIKYSIKNSCKNDILYIDEKYFRKAIIHLIKYLISICETCTNNKLSLNFFSENNFCFIKISLSNTFIPLENPETIFDPKNTHFLLYDSNTFDLPIANKIISDQRGTVKLINNNKSSCFIISLPNLH